MSNEYLNGADSGVYINGSWADMDCYVNGVKFQPSAGGGGEATPWFLDTFTVSADTQLINHTPDIDPLGTGWAGNVGYVLNDTVYGDLVSAGAEWGQMVAGIDNPGDVPLTMNVWNATTSLANGAGELRMGLRGNTNFPLDVTDGIWAQKVMTSSNVQLRIWEDTTERASVVGGTCLTNVAYKHTATDDANGNYTASIDVDGVITTVSWSGTKPAVSKLCLKTFGKYDQTVWTVVSWTNRFEVILGV